MRSKVAERIVSETPKSLRDRVREYWDKYLKNNSKVNAKRL